MINPVSFTSSYIANARGHNVKNQKNFIAFRDFTNIVLKYNEGSSADFKFQSEKKYPYYYQGTIRLNVPDSIDGMVENYCNYHGINVKKISTPNN